MVIASVIGTATGCACRSLPRSGEVGRAHYNGAMDGTKLESRREPRREEGE